MTKAKPHAQTDKIDTTDNTNQAPTSTFEVISPLSHNHVMYAIGDYIELTDEQAAQLKPHTVRDPAPQLLQLPAETA